MIVTNKIYDIPELDDKDLEAFIETLSNDQFRGRAGNRSLRNALNWVNDADRYWSTHGRALDQGLIVRGRGKGGSVQILEEAGKIASNAGIPESEELAAPREIDLYDPAKRVIDESWAKNENYDEYVVSITGMRGRANTGGKWTRPDIAILAVKAYPYLPQRHFEIVTFEVKPAGQTTVEGIFEALSHQQFATRAYAVFHVPDFQSDETFQDKYPDAQRILSTARKHGVGVILATDIGDWEAWEEILGAERVHPDPEQANRFIATGFPQETRDRIIKWHK